MPRPPVPVPPDDRDGATRADGCVVTARVAGAPLPIGSSTGIRPGRSPGTGPSPSRPGRAFQRTDAGCGPGHGGMHTAPVASALRAMLACPPHGRRTCAAPLTPRVRLTAEEPDRGTAHEQVRRPIRAAQGSLNRRGRLPAAWRRDVRHRPARPRQRRQAGHRPGILARRELGQHLHRQAELDGRIGKRCLACGPTVTRRAQVMFLPIRISRAALARRCVASGSCRRAMAVSGWPARAARANARSRDAVLQTPEGRSNATCGPQPP